MKFIKASKTLPDEKKYYNCRINGIPVVYYIDKANNTILLNDNFIPVSIWDKIEWLDESPSPHGTMYVEVDASKDLPPVGLCVLAIKNNLPGCLINKDERFVEFTWFGGVDSHTIKSENLSSIKWFKPLPGKQEEKVKIAGEAENYCNCFASTHFNPGPDDRLICNSCGKFVQ